METDREVAGMKKSQRGSVTVIALVMVIFLLVIGVGWIMLLTQERSASGMDEREQQAWYAAEAGMKRAKAQLHARNTKWTWLSTDVDMHDQAKINKVDMQTLAYGASANDKSKDLWYGVYIDKISSLASRQNFTVTDQTYNLTAVGCYQGVRKVIKDTYKVATSGDSGGEHYSLGGEALAVAGGKVTLSNSQGGTLNGDIYAKNFKDTTGGHFADGHYKNAYGSDTATAGLTIKTHIPTSVFDEKTYSDPVTMEKSYSYTLTGNGNYYWDIKSNAYAWFKVDATQASGATIYLDGKGGQELIGTFDGPTSGYPLTLIVPYNNASMYLILSGRIRILAAGKITMENGASQSTTRFLLASNGNVTIDKDLTPSSFISSDGNLVMMNHGFTGQMQAAGNITLEGTYTYDKVVLSDPYMLMPAGMTASKNN